ncbi:MAG TPA: oxidoreductase [Paraburkholderia sp.]|jgi:NAD(P)-dependent dehydrogenase (short-subunit alcohol dehydrogenase family)
MFQNNAPGIFLITGVSSGFGRALSETALADGHRVVGTLRHEDERIGFEELKPGRSFGRLLDVTDTRSIVPLVADIEASVGPIDVLVNNAGYGYEGTIEESPLEEMRRQFDVNVFGAVAMTKAVLPYMRTRRAGHIINITSMGGIVTFPGLGYYHSSKFALEGFTEVLCKEMKPFGVSVTALEPGGFRTDWAGRSMVRAERSIDDYDDLFEPLRIARKNRDGKQPGDPGKAARAILTLVQTANPPCHLLLGSDALGFVREKLADVEAQIKTWEKLTVSTDFKA